MTRLVHHKSISQPGLILRNLSAYCFLTTPQYSTLTSNSASHQRKQHRSNSLAVQVPTTYKIKALQRHNFISSFRFTSASTMSPLLTNFLIAGGTIAGAGLAVLFAFQERIVYLPNIPTREYEIDPSHFAMRYSDEEIVTEDGVKLHAWLIRHHNASSVPTFIYFHGNAGNIGHRLPDIRKFVSEGYNVMCVSYRGYGKSEGSPSEQGIRRDALAALKHLRDRDDIIDVNQIFIFGRSIGGAAAIALAAHEEAQGTIRGLVVENTFTSIDDMIDSVMPFLKFAKPFNRNKWASFKDITKVKVPILFLSGQRDELVPPKHMKKLEQVATTARFTHFHTVPEGGHNNTWAVGGSAYRLAIRMFTEKALVNGS